MTGQAWSGRFAMPPTELALRFGASLPFDCRLALHDICASRAHASMLFAQGIINRIDHESIQQGFNTIEEEIGRGNFPWKIEREDVHLNLEARLTELVGEAGKRLHTARSRNDQVATSLRLWLRDETDGILLALIDYQAALVDLAEKYATTAMPGYTHLQVAQPITVGHHLMSYYEMAKRDKMRLTEARMRINQLPLGAAALAGTSYPIDRQKVANLLGFDGLCENSIDAVSDRDFALEFSFAATVAMVHLSRLSEELILWASRGWVKLPEGYCTGSSIMPQKMNPDIPELVRGKCGRVTGHLMGLLMLMKAQPLAYNKDNQEDKEPLFDTVDTLRASLQIYAGMLRDLIFNAEAFAATLIAGFSTATDLADYLVKKGMAFRDAHEAVSKIVRHAESTGQALHNLSLDELRRFAPQVDADVSQHLEVAHSLASRDHLGGTAPKQVLLAIAKARKEMTHAVG